MAAAPQTERNVDLDVVIVSYRCRDLVARCVESVHETVLDHSLRVVVVDNDSRDGTVEALEHAGADVIALPANVGFASGNNRGIAAGSGRYVLVLNPDTIVEPAAIDLLVRFADERAADGERVGVVAPQLLNADGSDQQTARSFPTPAAALFGRRSPLTRWFPNNRWSTAFLSGRDHRGDEPFATDWVSGACMLVPRRVIDDVGPFDASFFLYWEDAEWCRRIKDGGYSVWTVPKARVWHDEGGTRGHGWPAPIVVHFHRGAYLYWRKHHAPQAWNPLRWLAAGLLASRAAVVIARDGVRARIEKTTDRDEVT